MNTTILILVNIYTNEKYFDTVNTVIKCLTQYFGARNVVDLKTNDLPVITFKHEVTSNDIAEFMKIYDNLQHVSLITIDTNII